MTFDLWKEKTNCFLGLSPKLWVGGGQESAVLDEVLNKKVVYSFLNANTTQALNEALFSDSGTFPFPRTSRPLSFSTFASQVGPFLMVG